MSKYHLPAIVGLCIFGLPMPLRPDLSGGNFEISGPACQFPDAAYSSGSKKYLVVWADYNEIRVHGRLVAGTGLPEGLSFPISEEPYGALFPAVAYGAARDEFLVTWDDFNGRGEVIHGQRVRASDGALVGKNFAIGSVAGGIRSAVAWSAASDVYLVVYYGPGTNVEVYGQRVSGAGALLGGNFNISKDNLFSGYPAVAWGSSGNQFLVTWDNDDGNIHGRRVDAAAGTLLGTTILVTQGGAKDRSAIAYDSLSRRWLVQYNDAGNPGRSYDQSGQFVNSGGTLEGGPVAIANSTGFEGDTLFGGDIAFAPLSGRFFSSFGTDTGMGGQELLLSGSPACARAVLGTGYYTSLNNAADGDRNRFLTVWQGLAGTWRVYGQLWAATLNPPEDFKAAGEDSRVALSWRNPGDPHFTGIVIRHRPDRHPEGPEDGELLIEKPGTPGAPDSAEHEGLPNWTTRYYAAFSRDAGPNYSRPARAIATPRPQGILLSESDFNAGDGGWTLATWRAGTLSPGTIAWDSSAGNILSSGSGITNNRDSCTREGTILTRAISTAGHRSIQVEYDVQASLSAPPGGSAAGSCAVLEGTIEDKLVLYYSTTGTGGPWTAGQILSEGLELPTPWARRFLNLAGIEEAGNNPDFALRFQWQFNHEGDSGRLDNIRVLSGAVTGPAPEIGLSAIGTERTIEAGENLPPGAIDVWNPGEGTLHFTASEGIPWLSLSPASGSSAGPPRRIAILWSAAGLEPGDREGSVLISSPDAANSPQEVPVRLHVVPKACLWEPFEYYDGGMTAMGSPAWSGSAADRITVKDRSIEIVGGSGAASAVRALSCGGGGILEARIKIRKGAGSGDFFWNIAIEDAALDPAEALLARWYGGSTMARGRIGATATPDMLLTGPDVWDDLLVRIDAPSGDSEFYFNGVSYGTISKGTGSAGTSIAIRIESIDRATAGGNSIGFDDLSVRRAPSGIFHRGDPNRDGALDLSDALHVLFHLFGGGAAPACRESADFQNDGAIDLSDALSILGHLFLGGPPPAAPGPPGSPCGPDPDPPGSARDLGCSGYDRCD